MGVGSSPSYGTTGQFLTSQGSAASPTWTTPSSGAMTLISTQTASSSASLSWTGLSGYDKYLLIFQQLVPSANANFVLTIGTGSGPTYLTSNYDNQSIDCYSTTVRGQQNYSNSNWTLNILAVSSNTGSTVGLSGQYFLSGCLASGSGQTLVGTFGNYNVANSTYDLANIFSYVPNTSSVTAIKITPLSGTILTGKASLYGISS